MNQPDPLPPMPPNFGWRYILWFIWCNAITGLMLVQVVVTTVTLDPTLVSHDTFHYLLIANAVICAVIAQIKRNNPPSPPPTKGPSP